MKFPLIYITLLLVAYCVCNLYESVVKKDEFLCKLLQKPEGIDDTLIHEYRSLADLYREIAEEVKTLNKSVIEEAKQIYERGKPKLLDLKYSLGRLKLHYNWGHRESNFFEFLNLHVKYKWEQFEEEYRNYTMRYNNPGFPPNCEPMDCV